MQYIDDFKYTLSSDGVLTITGSEIMPSVYKRDEDGNRLTNDLDEYDAWSFFRDMPVKELIVEEGIIELDNYCFAELTQLKRVVLPKSLTHMGEGVFCGCEALEEVIILGPITSIPVGCFVGCSNLRSLELPSSVEHIGYRAFYNCPLADKYPETPIEKAPKGTEATNFLPF